jgi:NADH:ubiquinone oxidoreductase subunit 4 (subunit M)
MILGAVYMLKAYQLLMLGPANPEFTQYGAFQNPMSLSDKLLMLALATLILFLGLFPQRLLEWIDTPIQNILNTN